MRISHVVWIIAIGMRRTTSNLPLVAELSEPNGLRGAKRFAAEGIGDSALRLGEMLLLVVPRRRMGGR